MINRCTLEMRIRETVNDELYVEKVSGSRQLYESMKHTFRLHLKTEEVFIMLGLDTRYQVTQYLGNVHGFLEREHRSPARDIQARPGRQLLRGPVCSQSPERGSVPECQ